MDLHELRTGFKDWRPTNISVPEMPFFPSEYWPIGERTQLDIEMDRLIDSWKLEEWEEETEEDISSGIRGEVTDEAWQEAFEEGFTDGESQGLNLGRTEGYKEGYADARKYYEEMKLDK